MFRVRLTRHGRLWQHTGAHEGYLPPYGSLVDGLGVAMVRVQLPHGAAASPQRPVHLERSYGVHEHPSQEDSASDARIADLAGLLPALQLVQGAAECRAAAYAEEHRQIVQRHSIVSGSPGDAGQLAGYGELGNNLNEQHADQDFPPILEIADIKGVQREAGDTPQAQRHHIQDIVAAGALDLHSNGSPRYAHPTATC